MIGLLYVVGIFFAILQIILFFKIWGMTNNIQKLTDHFLGNTCNGEQKIEYDSVGVNSTEGSDASLKARGNGSMAFVWIVLAIGVLILVVGLIASANE